VTTSTDQLRERLEAKIAEAEGDIERMKAAVKALGPAGFARASHQASPKAMAKLADTPAVVPAGKLVAALRGIEGMTTRQLAKETGGDSAAILELLKGLEADDKVSRTGQKAATRWHALTKAVDG
jgi:hypothetical protein